MALRVCSDNFICHWVERLSFSIFHNNNKDCNGLWVNLVQVLLAAPQTCLLVRPVLRALEVCMKIFMKRWKVFVAWRIVENWTECIRKWNLKGIVIQFLLICSSDSFDSCYSFFRSPCFQLRIGWNLWLLIVYSVCRVEATRRELLDIIAILLIY